MEYLLTEAKLRGSSSFTIPYDRQGLADYLDWAKANGITRSEIAEILTHAAFYAGWPKAWAAFRLAKDIWTETDASSSMQAHQRAMVFPIGAPNDGFS